MAEQHARPELKNYDAQATTVYVRAELDAWLETLADSIHSLDALDNGTLPPEQAVFAQHAKDTLAALEDGSKVIDKLLYELGSYIARLEWQRESSRQAFEAGWEASYKDIIAELSDRQYQQLREALKLLGGDRWRV